MMRSSMRRMRQRWLWPLCLVLLVTQASRAQRDVSIGVLGLFHPKEMLLEQGSGEVISVTAADGSKNRVLTLNGEPGHRQLVLRADGKRVLAGAYSVDKLAVTSRGGGGTAFRLMVPGKIRRVYRGRLTVEAKNGELLAVVMMDRELAVASIVGAEMNESTPMEALKAQAVATRSFLSAGARHTNSDFCDTTHCQFLKSPPPPASRISRAVAATRGLVILYQEKPLGAMYSSRCGGRTRSLRDVGMDPGEGYPYFAVECKWCLEHPLVWQSRIGRGAQAPVAGDEGQRIARAREWGWSAIPGNDFTATEEGSAWHLEGHNIGHSVGMCQFGAVGMAASGAGFREILAHYYPNTTVVALAPQSLAVQ